MASKEEPTGKVSSDGEDNTASASATDISDRWDIERITQYFARKFGFRRDEDELEEPTEKILEESSVDGIIKYIKDSKCKNIITMAGAGISTSAGIPDFRSPGSGLYHNLEKYNLPDPQAIFEIGFFRENPKPFFTLAKELYPGSFKPTVCHYFIRLLQEKGLLLRHYTQNIDTLERVAGIPGEKIVEAHGTFHTSHCIDCHSGYSMEWIKEKIFADSVPTCEDCNGIVKPDIVFFGENLPTKFFTLMQKDFPKCDLLIIMGSSLAVQPFASLIDRVPSNCPRLLVNREKAGERSSLMVMMGLGGLDFKSEYSRDVALLGDCDYGCQLLADKLGWGDELRELVAKEHKRIDEENSKNVSTGTNEQEIKGAQSEGKQKSEVKEEAK
ncbi:NAD-dependent protein deacetylase sirtuin-2 [Schistocerca gregaria]|uniref:NAD-dependent protein deacetylase n=1 Tax=Schistocerca gregaria TaxID=7010 RepID=A0A8E5NJC9_SCHGR|nr:NAD-dependent protein deacetylase sirtuin-2 [Schistocerca gregaria]QVD39581.1 NAD-dependent protein deacetylase sirtuin-2 [Schistocerca gregaria]